MKYDMLRERALANSDVLFDYWGLSYVKISDNEYDFLNPKRDDKNFGACRFNIAKGRGADFAGVGFSEEDYKRVGIGFDKEDFHGYTEKAQTNYGFDIIGLCQRLKSCNTYKEAAGELQNDLTELSKSTKLVSVSLDAADRRRKIQDEKNDYLIKIAIKTWKMCGNINLDGSIGGQYLINRALYSAHKELNIRFHPKILNSEINRALPTLLLRVQVSTDHPLTAIHRIYLDVDASKKVIKADLKNPKMALARIKGAGIWFGTPDSTLCIAEGPENALSLRELGYKWVVSAINATNIQNIRIPEIVEKVIIFPDNDPAGIESAKRAVSAYTDGKRKIVVKLPPSIYMKNGKKSDWNDYLQSMPI